MWLINKHFGCTAERKTKRTSHVVEYIFELIQKFYYGHKRHQKNDCINFMIHTVWFYGQCFANKEFLAEVLEYNLKFARNTFFQLAKKK